MFLDTIRSDHDEDVGGVQLRTPPGASEAVPAAPIPQPIRRDLLVDISCARALMDRFGEENDAFRIIPVELVTHLAAPNNSFLSKATAIVMGPMLSSGVSAIDAIEQLRGGVPHVGMYVVASGTSEVAKNMMRLAAAHPARMREMGEQGREIAASRLTWKASARTVADRLAVVLTRPRRETARSASSG